MPSDGPRRCARVRRCRIGPAGPRAALAALIADIGREGIAARARRDAEIVLAEVLNNIVEHAYGGRGGWVEATLRYAPGAIIVCLRDGGRCHAGPPPDAPGRRAHQAPGRGAAEGGYGLPIVRALARGMRHRRHGGVNRLELTLPRG
jgi:serine/threonine-protein kinase RsbW